MKKAMIILLSVYAMMSFSMASADGLNHHVFKKEVYECGDFSTAVSSLTAGFMLLDLGRCDGMDNSPTREACLAQFSNAYFIAKFRSCKCQADVLGELDGAVLAKCFVKSKIAANVYGQLLDDTDPLSVDSLTLSDFQESE